MEGLGLLRDGWTVIVLRRRAAARKSPEHNQSEERLVGPHRPTLIELANLLCIELGISVNERKARFFYRPVRRLLVAAARGRAYTIEGGKGSRAGSGLSFAKIALGVRMQGENG
jgi:hypothetical protein